MATTTNTETARRLPYNVRCWLYDAANGRGAEIGRLVGLGLAELRNYRVELTTRGVELAAALEDDACWPEVAR